MRHSLRFALATSLLALALAASGEPARAAVQPIVWDLKALVWQKDVNSSKPGPESVVTLLFSPPAPSRIPSYPYCQTVRVYRHERTNGRSFAPIGSLARIYKASAVAPWELRGGATGSCADPTVPQGWVIDPFYGYVTFTDTNNGLGLTDYEEYYYAVWTSADGVGNLAFQDYLQSYVVTAAFPPTQTRHGNFSEYTNACTACHGLHSARHKKLLKGPTVTDLCGTCHDGTGSKYDEVRGRVRRGDSWSNSAFAPAGPFGDRLKDYSGMRITSVHNVMRARDVAREGGPDNAISASARIWQAPGSGYLTGRDAVQRDYNGSGVPQDYLFKYVSNEWGSFLVCSSCHEPHNRGKNYRILQPVINDRVRIVVRGVSEVNLDVTDPSPDRGEWGNGRSLRRAMYTKHLSGGGSVLSYYDPAVEDPAWRPGDPDSADLNHDGNRSEPRAAAYCSALGGRLVMDDRTSPTGFRCERQRFLGGIVTFCTACHRAFMWPDARIARDSYAYSGGAVSGMDRSQVTNSGAGPVGLTASSPVAALEEVLGQHKHPLAMPAADALRNGRIIDGVLASDGDVCAAGEMLGDGVTADPNCAHAVQGRVIDPVVPLEGQRGDSVLSSEPYQENIVSCLTCHVPHGSGSERLEVAYQNGDLNDTASGSRDPITGYLWNRAVSPSPGPIDPRWETEPRYLPVDAPYYTVYGFSSALARFNPFASACFRCHSTVPGT